LAKVTTCFSVIHMWYWSHLVGHLAASNSFMGKWPSLCLSLLLSGELLAERCHTDDLMPSIPVLCLPPSRVDPKVLELNV